jgi:hypothetical protein
MKPYRLVAEKIERFDHTDYVKARIYLEIQDLFKEESNIVDVLVQKGYEWWSDDEDDEPVSPEQVGAAIWYGYQYAVDNTDFDQVMAVGLSSL